MTFTFLLVGGEADVGVSFALGPLKDACVAVSLLEVNVRKGKMNFSHSVMKPLDPFDPPQVEEKLWFGHLGQFDDGLKAERSAVGKHGAA